MALRQKTQLQLNVGSDNKINQPNKRISYILSPAFQELQLNYNAQNQQDIKQLNMILNDILHYPNTQFADLHKHSNKLGNADLQRQRQSIKDILASETEMASVKEMYCPCCGFIKQQEQIKICTKFSNIKNIGISTFLYFQTTKNIIILLVLMAAIYGAYALGTNIRASNTIDGSIYVPADILSISLGAKQVNQTDINKRYYYIQAWIGAALMIVWMITIIILKYFQNKEQLRVEVQTKSASDFSIVIENIPADVQRQDLQKQFNDYFSTIVNVPQNLKKPLNIVKFNKGKPFFLNEDSFKDEQLENIIKQMQQAKQTLRGWIKQRQTSSTFTKSKQQRLTFYKKYNDLFTRKNQKIKQMVGKISQEYKKKHSQDITTLFITFDCSYARRLICNLNPFEFSSKMRYYLTCCKNQNRFRYVDKQQGVFNVKIYRAPQPEDVKWQNLGIPDSQKYKRKLITFLVTFLMLGISFAIVYGLSVAQKNNSNNRVLSFIISLTISFINAILGQIIRYLTIYQRDYTQTNHQTSLAIKSIFAQIINSILVPMIANYFIKNKIYQTNGLSDDIFYLAITTSLLAPILKILDGYYFFTRIMCWWKNKPSSKLYQNQQMLNSYNQLMMFEAGFEYIHIVNVFLFTCFFVSLQPIIVFFALVGLIMMYWAQKYVVFSRCKRPVPGTNLINTAMSQWILIGGIVYSLGSLTWSNFMDGGVPAQALLPNLVALGLGVFVFIAPYQTIFDMIFQDQNDGDQNMLYKQNRIFLPSEYDRVNPATSQEAFKEYIQFIEKWKEQLKKKPEEQKKKLVNIFAQQQGRGNGYQQPNTNLFLPNVSNQVFNPFNNIALGNNVIPPPTFNNRDLMMSAFNLQPQPPIQNNINPINLQMNRQIQQQQQQQQQQHQQQQNLNPFNIQQRQQPDTFQQPRIQQQQPFGFQQQSFGPQQPFGFQQQPFGFQQQSFGFQPQQQFGNGQFGFQQPQQQFGNGQFGFQQQNPFNFSGFGGNSFGF